MNIPGPVAVPIDPDPVAMSVDISDTALRITLSDGRKLSAPLAWLPLLRDAISVQRAHCKLIGRGHGLLWPDLDEDVSVRALMGKPT